LPGGFVRTFVDLGPVMDGLLFQLAQRGVAPEYLERVLGAFPEPARGGVSAGTRQSTTARTGATSLDDQQPSSQTPAKVDGAGSAQAVILIIDDDEESAHLLSKMLPDGRYKCLFASDGVEGIQMLQAQHADLVVLDTHMPRMNGWEACRRIRQISDVPIIMLSSRTDDADMIQGFRLGADDYITKPVHTGEFVARVQAVLRRGRRIGVAHELVQVDERLTIDREQARVLVDGQTIELSAKELNLLLCLLDNAGRVCTRQSLLTQVWGWEYVDEPNYLKVYIHHLRQKIEQDPQTPRYILTERGLGYRFNLSHEFNSF
jgi:two-component system KDP operon response regulator KdpE